MRIAAAMRRSVGIRAWLVTFHGGPVMAKGNLKVDSVRLLDNRAHYAFLNLITYRHLNAVSDFIPGFVAPGWHGSNV